MNIIDNTLTGHLIHTNKFGWQVCYEFGQNQFRNLVLHHSCIDIIEETGIEGEEVKFIIRGTPAPSTLNGVVSSALIIQDN